MAGTVAIVFVHQVDLDVADIAAASQVILPNQTIEVDRRGGACIDLVVGDFGYAFDRPRQFVQYACRFLHGCALRHVDDDLEL